MKRREFLIAGSITGLGVTLMPAATAKSFYSNRGENVLSEKNPFTLPELGYTYKDLEPYIDAQTMEIHHSKHHAGYVSKLNAALENHPLNGETLAGILDQVTNGAADTAVLNNAGGHYNHSLFWQILKPGGSSMPQGSLATALERDFGSIEAFMQSFSTAAGSVFGSGWAWLSVNADRKLFVSATRNQENPLMNKVISEPGTPILGIDVWEHAYYLKYQNRRKDYINNFNQVINWSTVKHNFEQAMQ